MEDERESRFIQCFTLRRLEGLVHRAIMLHVLNNVVSTTTGFVTFHYQSRVDRSFCGAQFCFIISS